jgi:hypothetical protein
MLRLLNRVQLAYMGLFILTCVGVVFYEATYVWPAQRCEEHGGWWSAKYHMCATPIPIWRFTRRMPKEVPAPLKAS